MTHPPAAPSPRVFKLSANENPFGPSPKAVQAMQAALPTLGLYPPQTDAQLKAELSRLHGLSDEHFVTGNGGCDVLRLAALAYLGEGVSAVVTPPTFPVYERTASQVRAEIVAAPLNPETFAVRPDALRDAITPDVKVVYLCNPSNPTGTAFGQETFDALLDAVPDDVLVIYDEVYYHFATGMNLPDAKAAVRAGRNLLVVHSFSKAYGLAGMRLGYGLARPEIVERLESYKNPFHTNRLGLEAGVAALQDSAHVKRTVTNNTLGRELFQETLRALGLNVWNSQANFVMFEVPEKMTAEGLTDELQSYGVSVRPAFGLDRHVRVSVGLPEANECFVAAMKDMLR